jgi:hypothetical protein
MDDKFKYDVFLSQSAKDKAVMRPLAERLRQDGLTSNAKGRRLKAEVEFQPSAFSLQPLLPAFGSEWAQLETGTFRFRDPLNKERCFLPLRLDDDANAKSANAMHAIREARLCL